MHQAERGLELVRVPDVVHDVDLVLGRLGLRCRRDLVASHIRGAAVLLCRQAPARTQRRHHERRGDHRTE
jgi:hypothetical protein